MYELDGGKLDFLRLAGVELDFCKKVDLFKS